MYCPDETTRKDWVQTIATYCLLEMVSQNTQFNADRLKGYAFTFILSLTRLIEIGANKNGAYGSQDVTTVLLYLVMNKHMQEAQWLVQQGAKPSCLLRWDFMMNKRVITPAELYTFLESVNALNISSDDNLKFNLLHYICYYGDISVFNQFQANHPMEFSALADDNTYNNDSAMSIALLSNLTSDDTKVYFASNLYNNTNLSICNKSMQNPIQLVLLRGKIGLLFQMLPFTMNVRNDRFRNTILHLAIKAHLPTIARYIVRFVNFNGICGVDDGNDTILTLAVKSNEEDLACEFLGVDVDVTIKPKSWILPHSENDSLIHQVLKRDMQELATKLYKRCDLICRDTNGDYPLHIALNHKLDQVITLLINDNNSSAYINAVNESDKDTPLHLAIKLGYYEHSCNLIEHGANINACNNLGLTPVHVLTLAAMNQYQTNAKNKLTTDQISHLMELMLAKKPDLEIASNGTSSGGNETCLHIAIRGGEPTESLALSCLKYEQKLVNSRNYKGSTPLVLAVENENIRLVQALCDANSELNVMNYDKETPLHIAVRIGNTSIVS